MTGLANRAVDSGQLLEALAGARESGSEPFTISAPLLPDGSEAQNRATVSVTLAAEHVTYRLASQNWWEGRAVEAIEDASAIATRLLAFVLSATGWSARPERARSPVPPSVARAVFRHPRVPSRLARVPPEGATVCP